jgi:hypothetical protein
VAGSSACIPWPSIQLRKKEEREMASLCGGVYIHLLMNFSTTHHYSMWKLEDGPSVATEKYSIARFKRAYSKKQLGHLPNYMLASRPW